MAFDGCCTLLSCVGNALAVWDHIPSDIRDLVYIEVQELRAGVTHELFKLWH
ncbi:exported hypothetical protein [Vibrio nigripulchritudo SO65]|nr:exported hypothetical protein [Vibrio nigripulchritudo AM115]CCN39129.1 exported hypothetical protein [Vibrio nigripulchritudo FTn2]CCN63890.1 exported hypothetical protein [Vibrio nigripulchritudo POn4]CCN76596.1 exported hypothetical protein [Vibrio nigripulchritudo SO65]